MEKNENLLKYKIVKIEGDEDQEQQESNPAVSQAAAEEEETPEQAGPDASEGFDFGLPIFNEFVFRDKFGSRTKIMLRNNMEGGFIQVEGYEVASGTTQKAPKDLIKILKSDLTEHDGDDIAGFELCNRVINVVMRVLRSAEAGERRELRLGDYRRFLGSKNLIDLVEA